MNILMLGNGYDLSYSLPTSYRNFLLTMEFLEDYGIEGLNTVGDVFGNIELWKKDEAILKSYKLYKEIYDNVGLNKENLCQLMSLSKNNPWYIYFLKTFNKNLGWIYFEKELAFVLRCFEFVFDKA